MTHTNQSTGNPDSDKLVMLVSADWAEKFLPFLGIEIPSMHQVTFRSAARSAVRSMIGDKDNYFYIDFTSERVDRTRMTFTTEARRKAPPSLVADVDARFNALLNSNKSEEATVSILGDAAWSIAKGETTLFPSKPDVSTAAIDACKLSWHRADEWYGNLYPSADAACWQSETEWDCYLRSLSPDQPSLLADYLAAAANVLGRMPLYWSLLVSRVAPSELEKLKIWFRDVAAQRAQGSLVFPSYMALR